MKIFPFLSFLALKQCISVTSTDIFFHLCKSYSECKFTDPIGSAVRAYWKNDINGAKSCACSNSLSKIFLREFLLTDGKSFMTSKVENNYFSDWEFLGPLPVGKLEVDGDPTFDSFPENLDIAEYVLTSSQNIYSELVKDASVSWQTIATNRIGQKMDITFNQQPWSELVQGTSNLAVYEFQGWARQTIYIDESGLYNVHCKGVHTIYLRHKLNVDGKNHPSDDNEIAMSHYITVVLAGDIYQSGKINNVIELPIGLIGIVLPLRGTGSMSFTCSISPISLHSRSDSLHGKMSIQGVSVYSLHHVPQLMVLSNNTLHRYMQMETSTTSTQSSSNASNLYMEYSNKDHSFNYGLVISSLFSLTIQNMNYNENLWIEFHLIDGVEVEAVTNHNTKKKNKTTKNDFHSTSFGDNLNPSGGKIRVKTHNKTVNFMNSENMFNIAAGQMASIPLELYDVQNVIMNGIRQSILSCQNRFNIVITYPFNKSLANMSIPFHFDCRFQNQSFLVSYLDHDGSVVQASIIPPVNSFLNPNYTYFLQQNTFGFSKISTESSRDRLYTDSTLHNSFPVLLTLHGSGSLASNHADSYKQIPQLSKKQLSTLSPSIVNSLPYLFGVANRWVIAPSRHGAHNWEAVGEMNAFYSLQAIQKIISHVPFLPQVDISKAIIGGHSMV